MTYRKGFQRLFVTLSVAWVAFALLVVGIPEFERSHLMLIRQGHVYNLSELSPDPPASKSGASIETLESLGFVPDPAPWRHQSRTNFAVWLAAISLLPPTLAYLLLFLIAPWVYRGFRSTHP